MSSDNPKRMLFERFAATAKALGSGHRLELLEHLAQGERGVEALARLSGLSIANASQHLQHLRRAGIVAARRNGKHILYRVADEAVVTLLGSLRRIAERNVAEVEKLIATHFHTRDGLEPVSREELMRRMRRGVVTVLDVRPSEEFAAGHLPGAINVPLKELSRRIGELPRSREVVAYCRGPYCVLSYEAVTTLRRRGFRARRLEEGYPEWKVSGLPLEVT